MENIKLYSSLSIQIDDTLHNYHDPPDDYSDNDAMVDLPESVYIDFKDDINHQLAKSLGESCNLAKYCHSKELAEKLHSINIEAVEFNDLLYAVSTVYIEEGMSLSETDICDIFHHDVGPVIGDQHRGARRRGRGAALRERPLGGGGAAAQAAGRLPQGGPGRR